MNYLKETKGDSAGITQVVGFFPGLGSRIHYQNIGEHFLNSGNKEIESIYTEAALAMGYGTQPEKMLITSENLPEGKMERQGFISASFLTHNLVLAARLREESYNKNSPFKFVAYSGESFGIINSAVASGALSVGEGVKIANFFTPYILLASEKHNDPLSHSIMDYYPEALKEQNLISELYYVVALRGRSKQLSEAYAALQEEFLNTEIELHKIYSKNQINVYVKTCIKSCFDIFMKNFTHIEVSKIKDPTAFLTHSSQLAPLRQGLENFLRHEKIVFHDPQVPVVANHSDKILTSKAEIYMAIIALVDQTMLSKNTAEMADSLDADAIIELGLGNKSVQLMHDNEIHTPVFSFTGNSQDAKRIVGALSALASIRDCKEAAQACSGIDQWLGVVRDNADFAMPFAPKIEAAIQQIAPLKLEVTGAPSIDVASLYKNSWLYRDYLQPGELALMARLRRNIQGTEHDKDQLYIDLKIFSSNGTLHYKKTPFITQAEKTLFYVSSLDGLSNTDVFNSLKDLETVTGYGRICQRIEAERNQGEPLRRLLQLRAVTAPPETQVIRRIILQMIAFELMKIYRPGLVQEGNTCLSTRDFIGWLTCLVTAGAASFDSIVLLCRDYYSTLGRKMSPWGVIRKFADGLIDAHVPVLSVNGLPLLARRDLEINTYKVFVGDFPSQQIQATLGCHLSVITLDGLLNNALLKTEPYNSDIILTTSIRDIWLHNPGLQLEQRERDAQARLTEDNRQVLEYGLRRNLLCSTINAYIEADEIPVHFCNGGSESMTMFIQRSPHEPVVVRKILSEALTAAKWHSDGKGVMLPPFAKAARQVDYLRALPDSIKPWFPQVYAVNEREILTPACQGRVGKAHCKEVIYEMSLVEGEEVSQFIKRTNPAPRIIARLYEIIITFLRDNVHSKNRIANAGNTLEGSYFSKIEDRLTLCQKTAPLSFSAELLDSEKIIINGIEYLNSKTLISVLRSSPEYMRMLEPAYHSLVMGDTNTENIKLANTAPLLAVQVMIDQQRSEKEIIRALAAITAEDIGLRFLDPRAIGYQSEGASTRDDYMYDNKPWHNSIGHYDEIHNEMFTLDMHFNNEKVPVINVQFIDNNDYQQAYQIADCAQKNIDPHNDPTIVGMEKYFAQVMDAVYDSTNPESIYLKEDPYWLVRFVFIMGTHFTAMPPFHFISELDGSVKDSIRTQRRPIAIYCEGIKWLNWALEMLQGKRTHFLGISMPLTEQVFKEVI
ncbi:hypothetical protein M1E08_04915 [Erwinia sp. PK3-005]